jgi:hypothetical protein
MPEAGQAKVDFTQPVEKKQPRAHDRVLELPLDELKR